MIESFSGQGEGGLLCEDKSENWNIFICQNSTVRIHWGKEVGVPEIYFYKSVPQWKKIQQKMCRTHRCPLNVPDHPLLLCSLDQRTASTFLGLL